MDENLRRYTIETKYKNFIKFCEIKKRMPKYNAHSAKERKMRLFYVNKKNSMVRGDKGIIDPLPEWEKEYIGKMESFKESIVEKLNEVLKFCKKYNKVPSYAYKKKYSKVEKIEKEVYKKYNAVKNYHKKYALTEDEKNLLEEILTYRNKRQLPRIEKIKKLADFCEANKTTPKQHVKEEDEKKLAEFLSSVKTLERKKKLTRTEKKLVKEIKTYAPKPKKKTKSENLKTLKKFIKEHKALPKNREDSPEDEKKLAVFYTKFNWLGKQKKLTDGEAKILSSIHKTCNVKTRYEKIEELLEFIQKHNRIPQMNNTTKEKKLSVFFNNLKNVKNKGKLKKEELNLFKKIIKLQKSYKNGDFSQVPEESVTSA